MKRQRDLAVGREHSRRYRMCNQGLGSFRESPALLARAAEYLDRHAQ